ncbi:MAG: archaetidylserine decarboxylase [Wenzhouxiangellaceae bacterium]|nr:archaetidylserine decarboxylase [Wenzhouxiangellaceae bacterium]
MSDAGQAVIDRLKAWPQYLLPQHLLTRLATAASRSRALRRPLIGAFTRLYPVALDECVSPAEGYRCFDDFFTRALEPDARAFPGDSDVPVSPCDGTLSRAGVVREGTVVQAKGRTYTVAELLGGREFAQPFADGRYITIYLAPHDYHRVHMPVAGRLIAEVRVPGRLFSVSETTTRVVDRLFARNERMIALFETGCGPVAVVMVAAMLVAGIETAWGGPGDVRPGRQVRVTYPDREIGLARGAELGRFHWGSTVIVLTPSGAPEWLQALHPGRRMTLGEPLCADPWSETRSDSQGP